MIVSNQRFGSLIEFALEVATGVASTVEEKVFLDRLRLKYRDDMYPGYDMLLGGDFPVLTERLFWSRVYAELSRKVLAREIANPDAPENIRLSLASDADRVSQMLKT